MGTLTERIKELGQLPANPGVLVELSLALNDPDTGSEEIERIVSQDPALASTLLSRANSAMHGGSSQTSSLRNAITRLGKDELLRVAATQETSSPLDGAGKSYGLAPGDVWLAARVGARCASTIAESTGKAAPSVAFTAALLRDCGKLAMDYLFRPGECENLMTERPTGTDSTGLERTALGFDHAEVGAELATTWGLPSDLVEAIRHHHTPPSAPSNPLVDIVHCADAACAMLGLGVGFDGLAYALDSDALERLDIGLEELHTYLADVAIHLSDFLPATATEEDSP